MTTKKCIGSAKFGIDAHEAPVGDFPAQPSQKDGLGRMCKLHWTEYTRALRKAALARKAADADPVVEARAAVAKREAVLAMRIVPEPWAAPKPEPTMQSQAAARVATKRAARVARAPKPGTIPPPWAISRVGVRSDEGQRVGKTVHETPLGEQIDGGTEEADIA